jgi:hypothetical protein
MGHAADRSAAGRQLQHQGSSIRSRLAASAAAAAAAAATEESDEEVVSAAEVLAALLPMGCYDTDEYYAEQQEEDTPDAHELLAAAAPPPTSTAAAHQGGHMNTQVADQSMEEMTGNIKADGVVRLQRSGKGTASCKNAAAPASPCKDQLMSQQQGCMSPAATAKAEQARAAAAAGTINPHVCQAILAALAAGAAAESIDLASTQRKFEVMEQQLHVPHSPAAAHLLSRMSGRSS